MHHFILFILMYLMFTAYFYLQFTVDTNPPRPLQFTTVEKCSAPASALVSSSLLLYFPYTTVFLLIWQGNFILAVAKRPNQPPSSSSSLRRCSLNKDMKKVCQKRPRKGQWSLVPWLKSLITFEADARLATPVPSIPKAQKRLCFGLDLATCFSLMCCCAVAIGDGDRSGTSCTRLEHVCVWVCVRVRTIGVKMSPKRKKIWV